VVVSVLDPSNAVPPVDTEYHLTVLDPVTVDPAFKSVIIGLAIAALLNV
jgi:hypothetical protein